MLGAALQVGLDLDIDRPTELRRLDTLTILASDWMCSDWTSDFLWALGNV